MVSTWRHPDSRRVAASGLCVCTFPPAGSSLTGFSPNFILISEFFFFVSTANFQRTSTMRQPTMVDVEGCSSRSPGKSPPQQPKATTVVITTDHRVKTIPTEFPGPGFPSPSSRFSQTAAQIHVVESTQTLTAKDVCSWTGIHISPPVHRFIQAHRRDDGMLQRRLDQEKMNVFFASWWRFAVQEKVQRRIQKKIHAKSRTT